MIARLIALWFSVGVMWITSACLYAAGTEYYHVYRSAGYESVALPLIVRIFMTPSGGIYFYPALFVLAALFFTWKMRARTEWVWTLVVVTLGTTVLFLTLALFALEAWRLSSTPYLHQYNGPEKIAEPQ